MRLGKIEVSDRRGMCQPSLEGETLVLGAETLWKLTGPARHLDEAGRHLSGRAFDRVGPEVALLSFGNEVGVFRFPFGACKWLESRSGKWGERAFAQMLEDIVREAAALPFAAGDGAAQSYVRDRRAHPDVLYQRFIYLRHVLGSQAHRDSRLPGALQAILRDPHRRMTRQAESVRIWAAREVDPAALLTAVGDARRLHRAQGAMADSPLARATGGYVPERVADERAKASFDTPENRFVKAVLAESMGIIDAVERRLRAQDGSVAPRVPKDCEWMRKALAPFARASLFAEVGPMVHLPANSPVLHRRRGYRTVFEHHLRLRASSRLPFEPEALRDLLELKDIARLYEMWCFFEVVRELTNALGTPTAAVQIDHGWTQWSIGNRAAVTWADGWRCEYNRTWSAAKPAPDGTLGADKSWSVPLRPDIAIQVPSGPAKGWHLLDAKFRLRPGPLLPTPVDGEPLRETTYKNADIYKMHTYRDALPDVRSVQVLYPGTTKSNFFRAPAHQGLWDGVGAIPLHPNAHGSQELTAWLTRLAESSALHVSATPT